eukprot:729034-Hanusia_phi.AAC.2
MSRLLVIISDPDVAKVVTEGDQQKNIPESDKYLPVYQSFFESFLPTPSMVSKATYSEGPVKGWYWARKAMAPAFATNFLSEKLQCLEETTLKAKACLDKFAESGEEVDLSEFLLRLTLDFICSSMFDFNLNSLDEVRAPKC